MFVDKKRGVSYLSLAEIARRWECRPENVSRFHCKVGGLSAIQTDRGWWVTLEDLAVYEERLRASTRGKIKKLRRFLERLDRPVEETI